jgi:hypothetical protein
MAEHSQSLVTSAAPAAVWRIWSEPGTWPSWNPDVKATAIARIAAGTAGTMETNAGGKHDVVIESVQDGRSFTLVSTGIPGHKLAFTCTVEPSGEAASRGRCISVEHLAGY